MFYYLIKVGAKDYKADELLSSLGTYSAQFRKERGCLSYDIYQDCDETRTYTVISKWQSYLAMQQHFKTHHFKILTGAIRVLGQSSELVTAETLPLTKKR